MQQQPTSNHPLPNLTSSPLLQNSSLVTQPLQPVGGGDIPPPLLPPEEKKTDNPTSVKSTLAQLDSQGGIRIDLSVSANALTLGRLLGKGGFGAVYESVYQNKPVAIKQ